MSKRRHLKKPPNAPESVQNGGIVRLPWSAIGMSRASWYRHGKPTTKPKRYTCADIAKVTGWSIRTIQRDLAKSRQEQIAKIREYMAQGLSIEDAIARELAEHPPNE
jgi:hypothetical protein